MSYVGRFAPSPTGPLHFGSLVAALASYLDAKAHGGKWLVRIEDIDETRCKAEYATEILTTLHAFGMHWDGIAETQSRRKPLYEGAMQRLAALGLTYRCVCSRKEIADSAIAGLEGPVYPGTCRSLHISLDQHGPTPNVATRVRTTPERVAFADLAQGEIAQCVEREIGDFVLKRRDGLFTYQLAVVVDDVTSMARHALANGGTTILRVPPTADVFPLVIEAARFAGSVGILVIAPSMSVAIHLARRLRRAGAPVSLLPDDWAFGAAGGCVVVGSRAAVWAPIARPGVIIVLDEHDEAYQQEQMPTWNARDVAMERAIRLGVPCLLVSPIPSVASVSRIPLVTPSRSFERAHWPSLQIIDRSAEEPGRQGLLSDQVGSILRTGIVVCVLNRKGRASSLICVGCQAVARCERCDGPMAYPGDVGTEASTDSGDILVCRRCLHERPTLCITCGRSKFRGVRMGVTRAREEVEALALRAAAEVTADSPLPLDDVRVLVGTEAVLYRVPQADVVVFLDFDSELLAPRYRAAEQALALLVRAARLVEGRGERGPGRLVVQTRLPDHEVLRAVSLANPDIVTAAESARRIDLQLPPYGALAVVSGVGSHDVIGQLRGDERVRVGGPPGGPYQVRASTSEALSDALAAIVRPTRRVRVEVDPLRA